MNVKSIIIVGAAWILTTFLTSLFLAFASGGGFILLFSFIPAFCGWTLHTMYIKFAQNSGHFPVLQLFGVGVFTLLVACILFTLATNPNPFYAPALSILSYGSLPTFISVYVAHWVSFKFIGAKNA